MSIYTTFATLLLPPGGPPYQAQGKGQIQAMLYGARPSPGQDRLTTAILVSRDPKKARITLHGRAGLSLGRVETTFLLALPLIRPLFSLPAPDTGPFALAFDSGAPGPRRKKKASIVNCLLAFQVPQERRSRTSSYVPFLAAAR